MTTIEKLMEATYPTLPESAKRVTAYSNASQLVRAEIEPAEVQTASVPRATLTPTDNGWRLVHRGRLEGTVTLAVTRPGRFSAVKADVDPVEAMDSFFSGPGFAVYDKARDEDVLELMESFANTVHPFTAENARTLAKAVILTLAYRAGFEPPAAYLLTEEVN